MRYLIVCGDGTWSTAEQSSVTNVCRLYNALDEVSQDGAAQLRHYQPGVGTTGGVGRRLHGALTGSGLSNSVISAYLWLTTTYSPGDRIVLFGFSRGAYTVRSLAGMIAACGLVDTTEWDEPTAWCRVERLYQRRYRLGADADPDWAEGLRFTFDPDQPADIPVHFIGVWETVGSLGIPDSMDWMRLWDSAHRVDFHDVRLNPYVPHARHAIGMDERRSPFSPTLWSDPAPGQDVKQVWFPGGHGDMGGGYTETGLSDGALLWMIEEAREAAALGFVQNSVDQIRPDPLGVLHDNIRGMFGTLESLLDPVFEALLEPFYAPRPRAVPPADPQGPPHPSIHTSAYERRRRRPITTGPYWPTRVLGAGESVTVRVAADTAWNATGLYLPPGDYELTASGQWRHDTVWSGPVGTTRISRWRPVEFARVTSSLVGLGGRMVRRLTGRNVGTGLPGTRRDHTLPWMALVGVIANEAVREGETDREHEQVAIGVRAHHHLTSGGYLYAYANDVWGFYGTNWGSVRLTVTRTS